MVNVWLMKTYLDWSKEFLNKNYIAIDEEGVNDGYGTLSSVQRKQLFDDLKEKEPKRRYGHIQRFFDQFYDEVKAGDILVLGTGQTTKFFVTAVVKIKGTPYFHKSNDSKDARHRFDVEILWQGPPPVEYSQWGWANRLEKLDTVDRLSQFVELYTNL
nr:hypothetical protein [Paenibacillus xylanexedens]